MHLETPVIETLGTYRTRLGESPTWDARTGSLYCIDIPAKRLTQWRNETWRDWPLPDHPGALALMEDGNLLLALRTGFHVFAPDTAALTRLPIPLPYDPQTMRFNDGRVDAAGNFWVGTINEGSDQPLAGLYRLRADGILDMPLPAGLRIANGIAFTPDNRSLLVADTPSYRIHRYGVDLCTGRLGAAETFTDCAVAIGRPDGAAMDANGCYWSALIGYVGCFSTGGELLRLLRIPAGRITMCAFGGEDNRTLFMTTADHDHIYPDVPKEELAGQVIALKLDVAGAPAFRYG